MEANKFYNPLRWDCEKQGCFNKLMRPKIQEFCKFLPRGGLGDVDAFYEINLRSFCIEWKSKRSKLPVGQRIAFENSTITGMHTAFVVVGNAETMGVAYYMVYFAGKILKVKGIEGDGWTPCDFERFGKSLSNWACWAQRQGKPIKNSDGTFTIPAIVEVK
jgi:hypothetical protein